MTNLLRIAAWNANGLHGRINELELFIQMQKIDICLISETHFTHESNIKLANYCIYRSDHPSNKARGGSAIIIHQKIKHSVELNIETSNMQVTTVSLCLSSKAFKVSAIYCPPRSTMRKNDYLELFKSLGNYFIAGGDYNAKNTFWGSRLSTPKGKELYQAACEFKCDFVSTGKPTYWPADKDKIPDLIDFFVVKGLSTNYTHIASDESLSSDHTPIILTVSSSIIFKCAPPSLANRNTDWEGFRNELDLLIDLQTPLKTPYQLECEVDKFVEIIQQAAWCNTPVMRRAPNVAAYPLEIRELVLEKRKARRIWQKSRAPQDKTAFNFLTNRLKNLIKENKNETINSFLNGLSADKDSEYSLWKTTKRLKRPIIQNPPIRTEGGAWAVTAKQKADLFARHLESIFKPFPRQTMEENTTFQIKRDRVKIPLVTLKELNLTIKTDLSGKKAPGYDLITGTIIKELSVIALRKLLQLINAAIRLKYVPSQWKVGEVIMIPKPGKPLSEVASYRPISLLPVTSKIFEKLLLKRLQPLIEERSLIPDHQFGFRRKHSTIDQVHRIVNTIEKSLEAKQVCSSVFLDVSQAFDKVWHQGLLYKLYNTLSYEWYLILKSYLVDRCFRVKVEDEYSDLKEIQAGVPQGSVLGPVLYLLYTRDIPVMANTTIATFADDTAVMAVAENVEDATNKIQNSVNKITNWTKKWRIKLNESKSVHVNFTNRKVVPVAVTINSQRIPYANSAKYLGMNLDAKLRWKEHVKKKRQELNIKLKKMQWLLGRHSQLSLHNKLLIYKQVLKPVWTYGVQLWGCTKKTNVKMIQTFQNKVLRSICNAPWYARNDDIHRDLGVPTVVEEIKLHATKHKKRLATHSNVEVLPLLRTCQDQRRLKRTKPCDLMC